MFDFGKRLKIFSLLFVLGLVISSSLFAAGEVLEVLKKLEVLDVDKKCSATLKGMQWLAETCDNCEQVALKGVFGVGPACKMNGLMRFLPNMQQQDNSVANIQKMLSRGDAEASSIGKKLVSKIEELQRSYIAEIQRELSGLLGLTRIFSVHKSCCSLVYKESMTFFKTALPELVEEVKSKLAEKKLGGDDVSTEDKAKINAALQDLDKIKTDLPKTVFKALDDAVTTVEKKKKDSEKPSWIGRGFFVLVVAGVVYLVYRVGNKIYKSRVANRRKQAEPVVMSSAGTDEI